MDSKFDETCHIHGVIRDSCYMCHADSLHAAEGTIARQREQVFLLNKRITALCSEVEYWRSAVARVDPAQNYHQMCQWCEATAYGIDEHAKDCPWKLAQGNKQ